MTAKPVRVGVLGVVLILAVAACGGRGTKPGSTQARTTSITTPAPRTTVGTSSVSTGPVRGVLRADNHTPKANRLWSYTVTVRDARSHPLSGRVTIEFVFGGEVVGRDTPPTHPVRQGRWHDRLTFPPTAIGPRLVFRAVVHTRLGSITLDWPIRVRK